MAKQKYVVAGIKNYFGGRGDQGPVFGSFRSVEFADRARETIRKEVAKKHWTNHVGIFHNGKFVREYFGAH